MVPGAATEELDDTLRHEGADVLLQVFVAVTQTLPLPEPAVTLILSVPCPELMIQPVGSVHVYNVAPATGVIAYINPD
jgi:hypothetical protein